LFIVDVLKAFINPPNQRIDTEKKDDFYFFVTDAYVKECELYFHAPQP